MLYFAIYDAHGRVVGYTHTWQAAERLCSSRTGYDWDVLSAKPRAPVLDAPPDDAPADAPAHAPADASAPSPNYRPGS